MNTSAKYTPWASGIRLNTATVHSVISGRWKLLYFDACFEIPLGILLVYYTFVPNDVLKGTDQLPNTSYNRD